MQENKNKRIGRVIPFERDGAFFLKRGSERLDRNDLLEAISYYHQAQRRDPENVDVQLAIAEVLTEMRRYEQSNRLLFPLLSLNESPAECFFGIACNFLGLQEFSHAHDSLESYLALDPDGEFVADALDMLDVIEDEGMLYSMPGVQPPEEREALNACARGRQLLENGRMDEAVKLLSEAAKKQPDIRFVRSNLALAYFCKKDFKRAMETVDGVLKEAPNDVQAHCNMLLFLHAAKDEEGVQRELEFLKQANTEDPQDWNRMAVVYMEMDRMQDALAVLKKLQIAFPYDEGTLHRLGVCRYHLGQYAQAQACYDRLLKIDPADTIAGYYRRVCRRAANGKPENIDWLFHYQVPYLEVLRRVRTINEASRQSRDVLKQRWQTDEHFRSLLCWSLRLPEPSAKRAVLSIIAGFGDREAERVLRHFQLDQSQPDSVKQDVFAMLKHMDAQEPYIAYLDGRLVQSRVSMRSIAKGSMPNGYQRVLEIAMETMRDVRTGACIMEAVDVFQRYMKAAGSNLPQLREQQVYALAAAIEYIACRNREEEVTKAQLCGAYGISTVRLNNAIGKIMRALDV
jgi:tetratricopeptide (TPR) repeat protein